MNFAIKNYAFYSNHYQYLFILFFNIPYCILLLLLLLLLFFRERETKKIQKVFSKK
jgi:hypothetical protein